VVQSLSFFGLAVSAAVWCDRLGLLLLLRRLLLLLRRRRAVLWLGGAAQRNKHQQQTSKCSVALILWNGTKSQFWFSGNLDRRRKP
jgi:hypothetical protein